MITMQTVLEQLTGKAITDALTERMRVDFEDFAQVQQRYQDAMDALRQELGEAPVHGEMDAIERQTASGLFFCGVLGIKANLDNFIDPVARNFLDADFEVYLRESTAHTLPQYQNAQQVRNHFFSQLSPEQKKLYGDVTAYVSYLETVGPKLAHYYGYILGNELLCRVIPGYHPDMAQTCRYRMMLEDYLGRRLCTSN